MYNNSSKYINYPITKILNFLFIIFPFCIFLGPFFADLIVSLSSLLFLIFIIYSGKISYLKNKYFYIFLIFSFYLIFVSLLSSRPLNSLESTLLYFRFGLFVFAIKFLIDSNNDSLKYFTISLTITFLIGLIYGFIYYFADLNKFFFQASYSRIPLPFTDEFILGSFFARLFPLFFCLYINFFSTKKIQIYLLMLITILSDILIYISGERTAFALISLSIILLILSLKNFRMIRVITLIVSLIIITTVTIIDDNVKNRMVDQTIIGFYDNNSSVSNLEKTNNFSKNNNDLDKIKNDANKNNNELIKNNNLNNEDKRSKFNFFTPVHTAIATSALNIFYDNSNIFLGIGPKLFRYYCQENKYRSMYGDNSCSTHPHHTYIQLIVETGLIGLVLIFTFFIYCSLKIFNHIYKLIIYKSSTLTTIEIGAYIAIILSLFPFIPSGSFFNNWLNCIYYLPLVFILQIKNN